jgi:N-acetylglucosaminyl-diphospho-decaprenol L-rhamnosyltransferase
LADLAVVIVTWNSREYILNALQSLFADLDAHGPSAEVYVVDSASSDGTAEIVASGFPQVKLIASDTNLGFATANNVAMCQIGFGQPTASDLPSAVYLLNPDTITQLGATRKLFDALMANSQWGLVGAQLSYEDGSFQDGAFAFPGLRQLWTELFPTPGRFIVGRFNGRYPRALYEKEQAFPVDFTLGATMMLRREVIQQTGMFDEQFFMYCEEVDWAWRIHEAGWDVYCVPSAQVVHLSGKSTSQVRPQSIINLWKSRLRLFAKHYPAWKFRLARWMLMLGMRRRLGQISESTDNKSLVDAYRTVCEMAQNQP